MQTNSNLITAKQIQRYRSIIALMIIGLLIAFSIILCWLIFPDRTLLEPFQDYPGGTALEAFAGIPEIKCQSSPITSTSKVFATKDSPEKIISFYSQQMVQSRKRVKLFENRSNGLINYCFLKQIRPFDPDYANGFVILTPSDPMAVEIIKKFYPQVDPEMNIILVSSGEVDLI